MLKYDDENLQKLFAALEPKRRKQALKGGFRAVALKVRKRAISNLRSSGIRSDSNLEKGIRGYPFSKDSGFEVTIKPKKVGKDGKGEAGMHKNRQGLKKPVLFWAEGGTEERMTKSNGGKRAHRKRAAHSTGRMKSYGFMKKTRAETRPTVKSDVDTMVKESIIKISQKYGCK